jgi:hypothetical protein
MFKSHSLLVKGETDRKTYFGEIILYSSTVVQRPTYPVAEVGFRPRHLQVPTGSRSIAALRLSRSWTVSDWKLLLRTEAGHAPDVRYL